MSWGVDIYVDHADGYTTCVEVVSGHTYNLTPMWVRSGAITKTTREFDGRSARELAPILALALLDAVRNPAAYRELNPPNGWGDYEGFIKILTRFATLCADHPTGEVRWNG